MKSKEKREIDALEKELEDKRIHISNYSNQM